MKAKRAAKSRKSRKSAKSKSPKAPKAASATPEQNVEADRILAIWKTASAEGLGGKYFEPDVFTTYEPKLRANILSKLQNGMKFDATTEENTKTVATDLGKVCAMFTPKESRVNIDTFQTVFNFMKRHPVCPEETIKGRGAWCDIPL